MYIDKVLPFLQDSELVRCSDVMLDVSKIFIPLDVDETYVPDIYNVSNRTFHVYYVRPLNIMVLDERDDISKKVKEGKFGLTIKASIKEVDYTPIASMVEVKTVDNVKSAVVKINDAYKVVDNVATDVLVNSSANGVPVTSEDLESIHVEAQETRNIMDWVNSFSEEDVKESIQESVKYLGESADMLGSLLSDAENGVEVNPVSSNKKLDNVYEWLNAYFALPESQEMKSGGREVVPLLIGPTAVFKSATVKALCKKYDYRLIDFRVAFTSRVDFSGLMQIGEVDDGAYSYACPMEEIVTCSDGFRDYCGKAYTKVKEILDRGYLEDGTASDGENVVSNQVALTDEQRDRLEKLLDQYKEYMKTPVLFFDEITRCKDAGVEGVLVQLLNQKRFNSMTLNGCKFVAATNLDTMKYDRDKKYQDSFDDIYDVNDELDVAYANRFMPLIVNPKDVEERWFDWANSVTNKFGKDTTEIHPLVLEFLDKNSDMVYTDKPIEKAIDDGMNENEIKSQTFPNYRTWDMLSNYLYTIDNDYEIEQKSNKNAVKVYRDTIINGLISKWAGEPFMSFLDKKGYKLYSKVNATKTVDDIGDFLDSSLSSGVPALMVGPSSMGKTSRVKAYMKKVEKKTGLKPIYIPINLSAVDAVDLMGMPTKKSFVQYVSKGNLENYGLGSVSKELESLAKEVTSDLKYGMTDMLTLRAPDMTMKEKLLKAKEEGREIILFFDECNRAKNPTVMSAMFNCMSDATFGGVSFADYKDKVKIVAACNMTSSDQENSYDANDEGYSNAASLDPALAARFALYWKKSYDEKDYYSWINFMEEQKKEGLIDGTIIDYFKSLGPEQGVREMAKVESRTLEKAQPSTRTLYQMSKDIKSMRGKPGKDGYKNSLYNGKVIITDGIKNVLIELDKEVTSTNIPTEKAAQDMVRFLEDDILPYANSWNSAITNEKVDMGKGKIMSAIDIMDTLEEIKNIVKDYLLKPMTQKDRDKCRSYCKVASSLTFAINALDTDTSDKRKNFFSMYAGQSFANDFVKVFNEKFGSEDDMDITIEMLSDINLIKPFIRRKRSEMSKYGGDTEKMIMAFIDLMKEFLDVHGTTLPSENYSRFIDEFISTMNKDNVNVLLKRSTKDVDDMYRMAEQQGNNWIMGILKNYAIPFSEEDIQDMKDRIEGKTKARSAGPGRRTRIL